jgi:hypothetical protein
MTCFIDDTFGLKNIEDIGEDMVAYECDYPHSDSVWPESAERLLQTVGHMPERIINKVSHENALRLFQFDAFGLMGGRQNCTAGALRQLATHISTAPVSFGGPAPLQPGEVRRPVTSGDIVKMFQLVNEEDQKLAAEVVDA